MTRFVAFGLAATLVVTAAGCGASPPSASVGVSSGPASTPPDTSPIEKRYAAPVLAAATAVPGRPPGVVVRPAVVAPFFVSSVWSPSGWMGDLNALSYQVTKDAPSADEWTYQPDRGQQGWAAVAYQWPDSNFGDRKGKDLSGKGYDRLTFKARSGEGSVRVVFKSGGHTAPGARFPASYEAVSGPVSLRAEWEEVTISLAGQDLSNVPAALVVVFTEQSCPRGGTVLVRDMAFRGPPE